MRSEAASIFFKKIQVGGTVVIVQRFKIYLAFSLNGLIIKIVLFCSALNDGNHSLH